MNTSEIAISSDPVEPNLTIEIQFVAFYLNLSKRHTLPQTCSPNYYLRSLHVFAILMERINFMGKLFFYHLHDLLHENLVFISIAISSPEDLFSFPFEVDSAFFMTRLHS
ncbi:unnamed protein product [Ilex paraguariensis]|uniref:Uncharacterized protein n=1 Tax=Ilex paraguariensis TaxID=185542 RepID=A0ABC8RXF2_9AQUA